MSTKILDYCKIKELQPAWALWKEYHPEKAHYAFHAHTVAQARRWQAETRRALMKRVGFQNTPRVDPEPHRIERVDRGDHIREKILIRTGPHTSMPVYVLLPKRVPKPWPVVIAFNGHGYGVKDIVGLWEDGKERRIPDGYHKDFAIEICRRGFAVAAPEIACFGERQNDFSHLVPGQQGNPGTCTHTAFLSYVLGGSVVGLRVLDGRRLVDYLATRADMDIRRLGAMGISGGGLHTFFSACLDPRIKACVVSGYYSTFRDSILAMHHCPCNFVPGLHEFGEMYDLVGLIAPRPMLVEAGTYDFIFPIQSVRRSVARARRVYGVWGLSRRVEMDEFEGRHQISGRRAYDFLKATVAGE